MKATEQRPAQATIALPPPMVRFAKHPIRWMRNQLHLKATVLATATIGMLMVAGAYFLLFEVDPTMKALWHHLVPDTTLRHNIRSTVEGLEGGLLAQQLVWNHYRARKPMHWLDRLEARLGIPNVKLNKGLSFWRLLVTPFWVLLYGVPGFVVALGVIAGTYFFFGNMHDIAAAVRASLQTSLPPQSAPLWAKLEALWTQDWDKKLMGYGAAFFFGRRPAKGVMDGLQLWFAERRVLLGRPVVWYHPPTFQARYNEVKAQGVQGRHRRWHAVLILAGMAIGVGLAGVGIYALLFAAGA